MEFEDLDVMYFHGRTVDDVRFTITGVIENDDLVMGISICSELDQFCKETGRTVSTGRALNQRKNNHGRRLISLYSSDIDNEFAGQAGFPKNYFVGKETDVFISYVKNYNYFTKNELIQEFGLFKRTLIKVKE